MEERNEEKLKSEIIENLNGVHNIDVLLFVREITYESNRLNKKEAVN